MSETDQKSQVTTATMSPDEVKPEQTQAAPDAVAPESAHQGATENDVTQILPPVSGPTIISQSEDPVLEVEIDPADEITPG